MRKGTGSRFCAATIAALFAVAFPSLLVRAADGLSPKMIGQLVAEDLAKTIPKLAPYIKLPHGPDAATTHEGD